MANLTKPTSLHWKTVRPRYVKVKARSTSPFTFQSQTYIHPGERWEFDLVCAPLKTTTDALACMAFLRDLAKGDDTFSLDVTGYVPSDVTSPMTVRLAGNGNEASWDIDTAKIYGFSLTVEQVIS